MESVSIAIHAIGVQLLKNTVAALNFGKNEMRFELILLRISMAMLQEKCEMCLGLVLMHFSWVLSYFWEI